MYDIPILMLHTVNDSKDLNPLGVLSVSSKGFESYLKMFQSSGYQMISLSDLICNDYDQNEKFVVLTFDDGFRDNLYTALPILKKYNAKATIFVNPAYFSKISDPDEKWGFMSLDEIEEMNRSGVFDIQAHTMTHEFIFTSDKIIDYYTPDKFEKYYWLAWMLFPDAPNNWNSQAYDYRSKIPFGYPIFEYGRRISSRKFIPDENYIQYVMKHFGEYKIQSDSNESTHGYYEDNADYENYVKWEIVECKSILDNKLNKSVDVLCFPGGGYNDYALNIAKECGFKCYMRSSSKRVGNNFDHLRRIQDNTFAGLNRTSFSLIHPGLFPEHFYDYWVAKLSLGAYQNIKRYVFCKKVLSQFLHG